MDSTSAHSNPFHQIGAHSYFQYIDVPVEGAAHAVRAADVPGVVACGVLSNLCFYSCADRSLAPALRTPCRPGGGRGPRASRQLKERWGPNPPVLAGLSRRVLRSGEPCADFGLRFQNTSEAHPFFGSLNSNLVAPRSHRTPAQLQSIYSKLQSKQNPSIPISTAKNPR